MRVDQSKIFIRYDDVCLECGEAACCSVEVTPADLHHSGIPCCPECGEGLELLNEVRVVE